MRCKHCDYRLWNIPTRRCPECGVEFKPSEYDFVPNSIRFCCPHCGQGYYGTSPRGHLVPDEFDCVSCGRHIHMDEMVLLPTEGVREEQTAPMHVPWLERRQRGFWRAWISTVGMALVSPIQLMRALPKDAPGGSGFWFALLTLMIAIPLGSVLFCVFPIIAAAASIPRPGGGGPLWGVLLALVLIPVASLIVLALVLVLWAAVTHAVLKLFRGAKEPFGRTLQAICYSAGAGICMGVPCLGMQFGWLWWIISAILMVKERQRTTGGKATAAVLTLPGLSLLTLVGGYALFFYAVFTGWGPFSGAWATQSETQKLANAIRTYAADHQGQTPAHAVELIIGDYATSSDFVVPVTGTLEKNISIAGMTLDKFDTLPSDQQTTLAHKAAQALPPGTVAYRVGDFVFTYRGIDSLSKPDPSLWIVILSPDPASVPVSPMFKDVGQVGQVSGAVSPLNVKNMSSMLQAQNALRAKYGLPPLPDPRTVTSTQPAVAPGWSPATASSQLATSTAASEPGVWIRVNQVGYLPADPKIAILSSNEPQAGEFTVGYYKADIGPDCGAWGPFRHNYRLDFTTFSRDGTYRVFFGNIKTRPFRIGDDAYKDVPAKLLQFMQLQRCGDNPVTGKKCHQQDGIDTLTNQRVDLVGGWHDAADRLKHMITTTYCTAALFLAGAEDEARHGAAMVRKGHPDSDTIYVQIGDDRDHLPPDALWQDDRTDYGWGPGGPRAAWRATGKPEGPEYKNQSNGLANLTGRAAAAMALAGDIKTAKSLYQLAMSHPGCAMSVPVRAPYYYTERNYLDDLEWAATELYIATREPQYLKQAIEYADQAGASEWMGLTRHKHYEFFPYVNLAHRRLYPHVDDATKGRLAGYYRAGLERVRELAEKNPYRLGTPLVWCSTNDVTAFATQAALYEKMTGDPTYRPLAAEARDWIFGRNPWGVSFVIGVPADASASHPHHLFHKLAGILPVGGLVDGPVYPDINAQFKFHDMGPDLYARFQSDVGVYHDCYADFSTNEPTIDGTTSLLLLLSAW